MSKQKKVVVSLIITIIVIALGTYLILRSTKESKIAMNFNKSLTSESFQKALNSNSVETISQVLISDDAKNSYKNWVKNIIPGSETDVFCKKSEFKIIKFKNGEKPTLEVKIISPDLTNIVKDIVKKNGSVPSKDIMTSEVRKVLNSNQIPKKTTNFTIKVIKASDGFYGMTWDSDTVNLLSGNLLGSMTELEEYLSELFNTKLNEFFK